MSLSARDLTRLQGVHPGLVAALEIVFADMLTLGHPMFVVEGLRTVKRQQELYAQGRTTKGMIVTKCDGVIKRSNHQVHEDTLGHAVDCAFVVSGVAGPFDAGHPWLTFGEKCEALHLKWGGRFPSPDSPHVELP